MAEQVVVTGAEKLGQGHGGDHPDTGPAVTITINQAQYEIHRGHQTVATIKAIGHVAPADDLEQIQDGQLVLLADDGGVTLKGGEKFVSHPKTGAAS